MPRQTLQPRDAGGKIQGKEHRRCSRHDHQPGGRFLRECSSDTAEDQGITECRSRIHQVRTEFHYPLWRCVKLATELSKRDTGKTLYILDEPTTGLHFEDIRILMDVLQKLVDRGNTVIIIEHNLDVIKLADWLIDMGPEGGRGGGQLLFAGTPEEMVKQQKGYTYKFLAPLLKKSGKPE